MNIKWKEIFIVLIMLMHICIPVSAQEISDKPKNLYAQSAVLMDADSGRILFGKNENDILPMASTTKIMTCILVLENMQKDQTVLVTEYAASQPKVKLGIKCGEEYYVQDLLYSLMLESHNDSAVALAEEIGGSVEKFAFMMNKKAKILGCEDTYFITPNGLDEEDENGIHSTTAADLARIMKYCIMESKCANEFLQITQKDHYQFESVDQSRSFQCRNHNAFLQMMEGAVSGKTGFTNDAGYCYVGALKKEERTFIVALLACGWPSHQEYKWLDTRRLMEYGLSNYDFQNLDFLWLEKKVPLEGGAEKEEVYVGIPENIKEKRVLLHNDEKIEIEEQISESLTAPVKEGQKAGKIVYKINDIEIYSVEVKVLESISEKNVKWCIGKIIRCWRI